MGFLKGALSFLFLDAETGKPSKQKVGQLVGAGSLLAATWGLNFSPEIIRTVTILGGLFGLNGYRDFKSRTVDGSDAPAPK